jgi:hypothetical protein
LAVAWAGTTVSVGARDGTGGSVGNGVGVRPAGAAGAQLSSAAVASQSTQQDAWT